MRHTECLRLEDPPQESQELFRHHEHDRQLNEIEREKLLSEGAAAQGMVMRTEPSAADRRISQVRVEVTFKGGQRVEFGEELANLYQPAPGSPQAQRLAEVRDAGLFRHPDRIPKSSSPCLPVKRCPSVTTPRTRARWS